MQYGLAVGNAAITDKNKFCNFIRIFMPNVTCG